MFILLDKPLGITSAKAVEQVKWALRARKAGHAGTLDPLATGLLIIATDKDTKRLADYLKLPKTYEAEVLFGKRTDTGDLEGKILEERSAEHLSSVDVSQALGGMVGTLRIPAPVHSAIKKGGIPLYQRVRRGERVEAPLREMEVLKAELLEFPRTPLGKTGNSGAAAKIRFEVGSGTYIRSLAEELGRRLGVPSTLSGLRRTQIGEMRVEDAITLEQIYASPKKNSR